MTALLSLYLAGCASPLPPTGREPVGSLVSLDVEAELEKDAVRLRPRAGGEGFTLRSAAWGRAGRLQPLELGPPGRGERGTWERVGRGIREWWRPLGRGLQQGWQVHDAPEGQGPLVILLSMEEARVQLRGDGLFIEEDSGWPWRVGGIRAWDADGRLLEARFEPHAEGVLVSVQDSGARYPLLIDPVYSTPAQVWSGEYCDQLGLSLGAAGDVNGDGHADVIAGAPEDCSGDNQPYAALFHGGPSGSIPSGPAALLLGEGRHARAVAGAGDVNGDGYDDVLIGGAGEVELHLGSATGLSGAADLALVGPDASFGAALAGLGDLNGDGYSDVGMGISGEAAVEVYLGDPGGLRPAPQRLEGGSSFGQALSAAGDLDRDGYADLAVGLPALGQVQLFAGGSEGVEPVATQTLSGSGTFGAALSAAGDLNGDGWADLAVGAPSEDSAHAYHGSSAGLAEPPATISTEIGDSPGYGSALGGGGDVDGDGFDDLVVGSPWTHSWGTGVVNVLRGSPSGASSSPAQSLESTTGYDEYGYAVAFVGDVDGDGIDDLVLSAPAGRDDAAGRVMLHLGYLDGDGDGLAAELDCDDSDPEAGLLSATWKDEDGDGHGAEDSETEPLCAIPEGHVLTGGDCDDADSAVHPGAAERCDAAGTDEDCDGLVDDADTEVEGQRSTCADSDGDGYTTALVASCEAPADGLEEASAELDCDDADPGAHPGATEQVGDEVDGDCDGDELCYADGDGDGYAAEGAALLSPDIDCGSTGEADDQAAGGDCDDERAETHPGATDAPGDGLDQDCDGQDGEPVDSGEELEEEPGGPAKEEEQGGHCDQGGGLLGAGWGLAVALAGLRRRLGAPEGAARRSRAGWA